MPLPSTLLTARHRDLDLRLLAGEWPDEVGGEIFVSAPEPTPRLASALFGFGVMIRLSLRPGTHGAPPDRFAWRARTIDSPTRQLFERVPGAFAPGPLGYASPLGAPNMDFKADPAEMTGGARSVRIDDVVPVFLVRKDELEGTSPGREVPMREFALAPSTGHYYACYGDRDGLRVLFEHMDLVDLGLRLEPGDVDARGRPIDPALIGMYNMAMAPSSVSEVELDPASGKLTQRAAFREDWAWNLQLSALDWSPEGLAAPTLHHSVYQGWRPGAVSKRALHHYRDRIDRDRLPPDDTPSSLVTRRRGSLQATGRFEFPSAGDLPTSPVFAPRMLGGGSRAAAPGGHDGWVACPVLSDDGLRVDLFDAADVSRGPVASIGAPGEPVPLLLHSAWMPRAAAAPDRERLRFDADVGEAEIAALPPELATAVREVASSQR